ncbi:MAG: COX15/CtaA family protein [Pseudomonadota bacterium]
MPTELSDWAALLKVALLGVAIALGPLAWLWLRHRGAAPTRRLHALTLLTLFLTFDLVLFGAFTRLTDSGLGCPDWPGCYGSASPLGARAEIAAAQDALPTGPVTHGKAWVEMLHRYLATAVGVLITVMATMSWWLRRQPSPAPSPWWATLTLAWVIGQGAFGALTVTMKLYPAIVTLHLLGGLGLLALLAVQDQVFAPRPLALSRGLRVGLWCVAGLVLSQVALGGWVSTNYAVLACRDFPTCQGQWWPAMDFAHAFTLRRELGATASGDFLPFAALTAIHVAHRVMAALVLGALAWLSWRLHAGGDAASRRFALGLSLLALWQLVSGVSNVVLGWPIAAAVAHTAGAAMLAILLASLLARAHLPAEPARQRMMPVTRALRV